jgi:uncharacterized protein (TIGR02302 family)
MSMSWRLRLALAALAWEGFWPAFWPVVAALLGFLVLASFDVLPVLPGFVHAILLLAGLGVLGWGCYAGWRAAALPDRQAARRRLERDSGLSHRPLEALGDTLTGAGDDPFAQALWAAHKARMAASTRRLRLAWPRTGLVRRDPYATRIGLALLLLIGLVAAGDDFAPRLLRALVPEFDKADAVAMTGVDLWINPPDYTGVPPIYLGTDAERSNAGLDLGKPIAVPSGSTVLAQVHGGSRTPKLTLDGEATEFSALDASDFSATAKLGQAKRLTVSQGGSTLAGYDLQIIPDKPPTAEWVHPPAATSRGALRLEYLAKDDYGIKSLTLEIRRVESDEPPLEIQLPISSQAKQELKGTSYQDLTPNPWAGLPVEMRLAARDAIDQAGISAPVKLTLPERHFRNPVAKAIIEQRKLLSQDSTQEDVVAETLEDLASRPALYRDDFTVFLALRAASERLRLEPGKAIVPGVQMLLWDTALKVEEGDEPEAQRTLRQAEQALQDALDHNASDAEISRLTNQLRQAINRYLQAMIQNAMQNGMQPQQPQSGSQQTMTPDDIGRLLDQMQQMSQSGARDAAKEALAQLQDLLENLRAGPTQGQGDGQAQQLMRGMQELAKRQQNLLDQAYRQAQRNQNGTGQQQGQQGQQGQGQQGQGQQGQGQNGESGNLAGAQSALRHQLDDMRRQLGQAGDQGEIGDALGRAERAMGDAVDALKKQAPGDAVGPQGEALDQLQQASRALAEQMRQNGQGGEGGSQAGRDPFGRNLPGQGDLDRGDVKIPEQSEMQRSREILDELRRRAGERARPQIERDYIDRLLKRF